MQHKSIRFFNIPLKEEVADKIHDAGYKIATIATKLLTEFSEKLTQETEK